MNEDCLGLNNNLVDEQEKSSVMEGIPNHFLEEISTDSCNDKSEVSNYLENALENGEVYHNSQVESQLSPLSPSSLILPPADKDKLLSSATNLLRNLGFAIFHPSKENFNNKHFFELLGVKEIEVDAHLKLVMFFPIILCNIKCPLVVENGELNARVEDNKQKKISYSPLFQQFYSSFDEKTLLEELNSFTFMESESQNIIPSFKSKFDKIRQARKNYFREGLVFYKRVIYPILLTEKPVKTSDWRIPLAYQRTRNLHVISLEKLDVALTYLNKQSELYEQISQRKKLRKEKIISIYDLLSRARSLSIPFLASGIFSIVIMTLYNGFLPEFFNILIGLFLLYVMILSFTSLKYLQKRKQLNTELLRQTYTFNPSLKLIQKDIYMLQNEFSESYINQFLFELGKIDDKKLFEIFNNSS